MRPLLLMTVLLVGCVGRTPDAPEVDARLVAKLAEAARQERSAREALANAAVNHAEAISIQIADAGLSNEQARARISSLTLTHKVVGPKMTLSTADSVFAQVSVRLLPHKALVLSLHQATLHTKAGPVALATDAQRVASATPLKATLQPGIEQTLFLYFETTRLTLSSPVTLDLPEIGVVPVL